MGERRRETVVTLSSVLGTGSHDLSPEELRHTAWVVHTSVQLLRDNWRELRDSDIQDLLDTAAASSRSIEAFADELSSRD